MKRDPAQAGPRRRLFWRLYLSGVLMLVAVAGAVTTVAFLAGEAPPWRQSHQRLAELVTQEAKLCGQDPTGCRTRIQAKLDEVHHLMQIDLAVYDPDSDRLAAAGARILEPLQADDLVKLRGGDTFYHGRGGVKVGLPLGPTAEHGYLLLGWARAHGPGTGLVFVLAVLAGLAVVAIPVARTIARPLERLTATAHSLAGGELSTRTGLDRKDEVGVLARAMDHMAGRLEHRERVEKEMLANISHELRTPLARIRVALELCEDEQADLGTIRRHLTGLQADVTELDTLVEDVLVTARLDLGDSGDGPAAGLRVESLQPSAWAAQVHERFSRTHPERELRLHAGDDLPRVAADPALLHRVADNLLENAVAYSPAEEAIDLSLRSVGKNLEVEVVDRGMGVEAQEVDRLFDPFFRTDKSRSQRSGGAGLGLTLCRRIVEAHGGFIQAESRPAGGIRIWFQLPGA